MPMLCRVLGTTVGLKTPGSGWDILKTKKQEWNRLLWKHKLQPLKTWKQELVLYLMEI